MSVKRKSCPDVCESYENEYQYENVKVDNIYVKTSGYKILLNNEN